MSVKFKSVSVIKTELGIQENGPVHKYLTKRCADYMDKYVPYNEGGLNYFNRVIETNKVIYDSPYAHYMYEGKVMGPNIPIKQDGIIVKWFSPKGKPKYYTGKEINYNSSAGHEFAGPHWDQRMWTAEKQSIIKEVQDYLNRGGK